MKNLLGLLIVALLLASVISLGMGINKLTKYENPDNTDEYSFNDGDDSVNAYVGGDAYNYIINSARATAFFVLSGSAFIGAILVCILNVLLEMKNRTRKLEPNEPIAS